MKSNDVSTIIIVNKSRASKTLQVRTSHIARLKHYAAGILIIITVLAGIVIYQNSLNRQQEAEKERLLVQLEKFKGSIPVAVAERNQANEAQSYIQSIEAKLQKINVYLSKRGLKGFSTKAVGGSNSNVAEAKLSAKETYTLYDDYLNRLVHAVAFTPMGYPRESSLTSFFGYRSNPFNQGNAEFHPGIDFRGEKGDEARCTANGRVVSAGPYGGYGNCVRIAHANNYETLYGHLSRIVVTVGQEVTVGQKIGEVGSTGRSTGNHLHYEIRKDGKAINPISFLSLNN